MKIEKTEDKIWFLHLLRGVAALIVVYTHWGEMFWRTNELCASISYSPATHIIKKPIHLYLTDWLYNLNFNFGSFGVSLFFLVSGFVIPISIEKMGSGKFLFRRIFRLYPVYAIGLLFTCLILYISSSINSIEFAVTVSQYFKNFSMFRDWFWVPSIDNINWTLENEIKFYLICAFLAWISNLKSEKSIAITIGVISTINYFIHGSLDFLLTNNIMYLYKSFTIIISAAPFVTFMFIGTCFYNLYKSNWSVKKFITMLTYSVVLFAMNMRMTYSATWKTFVMNYIIGLIVFIILYLLREKIHKVKVLDFFANISYPMYVIHGVSGYAILTFLYKHQPYPLLIMTETFLFIVLISFLIHKYVEIPFNKLGGTFLKLIK